MDRCTGEQLRMVGVMVHTKLYISLGYDYINVVYIGDLSSCNT
jgi:hypothetical protein